MDEVDDSDEPSGAAAIALIADPSAAVQAAARLYTSLRAGTVRNGWRIDGREHSDVASRPGQLRGRAGDEGT